MATVSNSNEYLFKYDSSVENPPTVNPITGEPPEWGQFLYDINPNATKKLKAWDGTQWK